MYSSTVSNSCRESSDNRIYSSYVQWNTDSPLHSEWNIPRPSHRRLNTFLGNLHTMIFSAEPMRLNFDLFDHETLRHQSDGLFSIFFKYSIHFVWLSLITYVSFYAHLAHRSWFDEDSFEQYNCIQWRSSLSLVRASRWRVVFDDPLQP
jgi:hypothetical protein